MSSVLSSTSTFNPGITERFTDNWNYSDPDGEECCPHFSRGQSPIERSSASPLTWCHAKSHSQVAPECGTCPTASLSWQGPKISRIHSCLLVVSSLLQKWPPAGDSPCGKFWVWEWPGHQRAQKSHGQLGFCQALDFEAGTSQVKI